MCLWSFLLLFQGCVNSGDTYFQVFEKFMCLTFHSQHVHVGPIRIEPDLRQLSSSCELCGTRAVPFLQPGDEWMGNGSSTRDIVCLSLSQIFKIRQSCCYMRHWDLWSLALLLWSHIILLYNMCIWTFEGPKTCLTNFSLKPPSDPVF